MNATANIRLENIDPPWFWALLIVAALVILATTYGGIRRRSGRRLAWALGALRAAGVLALVAALVKPVRLETVEQRERPIAAVILDDSQSMSLPHGDSSRYEAALAWLADFRARSEISGVFEMPLFDIAGRPLDDRAPREPAAEQTDMVRAIQSVERQLRGRHVAGAILVGDGRDTTGRDDFELLGDVALPVYTVGFAPAPDAPARVEILSVDAPAKARAHNTATIRVLLRKSGGPAMDAPLRLERFGRTLAGTAAGLPEGRAERLVELDYTPRQAGDFVYAVRAGSGAQRAFGGRGEKLFRMRVEAEPVRVLYLEGVLRAEARFLRERLSRDPDVDLIGFSRAAHPDGGALSQFMAVSELADADRLREIDVVLLGDFEAAMLEDQAYENLREWVRNGGGLMVLGGYRNLGERGLGGTALAAALPVETPAAGIAQLDEPFAFTPTDDGLRHPVLRVTGDMRRDAGLWASQPLLAGIAAAGRPRPGATVLARHPRADPSDPDGLGFVVLAVQPFGLGTTAFLAADTTWRWSRTARLAGESDEMYARFWSQIVRHLARRDADEELAALRVSTDAPEYGRGRRVEISVHRNPAAVPPGESGATAAVRLALLQPDGSRLSLEAAPCAADPDAWTSVFFPGRGGRFVVEAALAGSVEDGVDAAVAVAATEFMVAGAGVEMEDPVPNPAAMRRVSRLTGGLYADIEDAGAAALIADELPRAERSTSLSRTRGLWNSPLLFLAFIAFLSLEWTLRRRNRLA